MRLADKQFVWHPLSVHVIVRLGFADEFLLFHSSVLKPNCNLTLRQTGGGRDASSLVFSDELAGCVFFFKFLQLNLGVGNALFASSSVTANLRLQRDNIWKQQQKQQKTINKWTYLFQMNVLFQGSDMSKNRTCSKKGLGKNIDKISSIRLCSKIVCLKNKVCLFVS